MAFRQSKSQIIWLRTEKKWAWAQMCSHNSTHTAFWHIFECLFYVFKRSVGSILSCNFDIFSPSLSIAIALSLSHSFSIHSILILRSFPFLVCVYNFCVAMLCLNMHAYIYSRWLCTLNAFKRYFIDSMHYICTRARCVSVCIFVCMSAFQPKSNLYDHDNLCICNNNRFEWSGIEAEQQKVHRKTIEYSIIIIIIIINIELYAAV